jgi:transcriptional regulator with XRE-family HTH domain
MSEPKQKTKLALLLEQKGLNQREFAELVYEKTGFIMHLQNISNYHTGYKQIRTIKIAQIIAETLDVSILDVI